MSADAIECEVKDVARLLRVRTYTGSSADPEKPMEGLRGGDLAGEFNEHTRPTADEVEELITKAAQEVRARLDQDVPDDLEDFAKEVVALRTAMSVELSYYPERANDDDSAYEKFKELYDGQVTALLAALPDSNVTAKGIVSVPIVSPMSNVFPTSELLP